ncbi:hypothetical protein Syun_000812 [Stephania yunnanensis]|uniref:Cytochrome P450 n=1 Tax=Stephania yunnanensis TaxID=152371 RepID=A0AAP0LCJ4_9MAGN
MDQRLALVLQLVLFTLPLMLLLSYLFKRFSSPNKNLPPGPFRWPLIGNTNLNLGETQTHLSLCDLSRKYGPMMMLKFGTTDPLMVASSHEAAAEILKTHDRICSSRYPPNSVKAPGYFEHTMVWADCSEYWKMVRRMWRTELFSTKMLDSQASIREEKVGELLMFLRRKEGQVVQLSDEVFGCIINVLGGIIFDRNVYDYERKVDNEKGMKGLLRQLMEVASVPDLADLYPILGPFDLQRLRRLSSKYVKMINEYWADIVKEKRASKDHSRNNFLDILIQADFTDAQIDALFLDIFGAGSDTNSCTIEWAMSELIKNPDKLLKLEDELANVIGHGREVRDFHLENLPYLHACIKETLRLHPPLPFLLPHKVSETCQMMNYTIPKNSQIVVNAYAIHRDPRVWEDPLSFKPERFLNSSLDYQGNDFHYIPFGGGRRVCPALNMASKINRFLLASLVHNFEWSLPNEMKSNELDMQDAFTPVLVKAVPLSVMPRAKFRNVECT